MGPAQQVIIGWDSAQLAKVHLEGGPALDRLVHPELPPKIFQHQQFQSFYYEGDHRNQIIKFIFQTPKIKYVTSRTMY